MCGDPVIAAARELVILMRKNEKFSEELDAKEAALRAEMGRAVFACYGTKVGPDATMTLRFTDGVVRVVVDGNIESLHNDFVFRDDVPRDVSVHVDGIIEALLKIYDAHRIAKELTGK